VEDLGEPNLKESVEVFDIPALCWNPSWMPGQINPILPSRFNQSVGGLFSPDGESAVIIGIND
jgi:hypothetical protein